MTPVGQLPAAVAESEGDRSLYIRSVPGACCCGASGRGLWQLRSRTQNVLLFWNPVTPGFQAYSLPPSLREDLITKKPVIELTAGHLPPRGFGDTAGKVTGGHETSFFASSNVVISYLTKRISRSNLRRQRLYINYRLSRKYLYVTHITSTNNIRLKHINHGGLVVARLRIPVLCSIPHPCREMLPLP